jgi:hypothetical protein
MSGLVFQKQAPVVASSPNRADIACFVGFVARRETAIPAEIKLWLGARGWTDPPYGRGGLAPFRPDDIKDALGLTLKLKEEGQQPVSEYIRTKMSEAARQLVDDFDPLAPAAEPPLAALVVELNLILGDPQLYNEQRFSSEKLSEEVRAIIDDNPQGEDRLRLNRLLLEQSYPHEILSINDLLDLPVPIDTWEVFDHLFAWEKRPLDAAGQVGTSYMGAAIRSYFAQGGRKCYVVRAGDPWPFTADLVSRIDKIKKLIPGYPDSFDCSAVDRSSWRGVGHLFGLPDVSFLCLPDLADSVKAERSELTPAETPPPPEEQFVECSSNESAVIEELPARLYSAPRADEQGYHAWAEAVGLIADAIARGQQGAHLKEVQLVASVPIPQPGTEAERNMAEFFTRGGAGILALHPGARLKDQDARGIASAFVQLAYPWARTRGSANLPEQLESPDAILAGILARNALTRGAFRSAANLHLGDVYDLHPIMRPDQMAKGFRDLTGKKSPGYKLAERVSLFGPRPAGLRLLSDVTTSLDDSYRPASANRLVSIVVRAARRLGEEMVFEPSGERLWAQLRESLNDLLAGLYQADALRGASPKEAFHVRCDRSTMSQNDLDNGRVIAHVQFEAALPLDTITVVLAMDEGGQVSLVAPESINQEAA